jgi:hypothetical protein
VDASAEFQMSRGEAWRAVMIPRHWIWVLIIAAADIALPALVFHWAQPDAFGRALMLVVTLVVVKFDDSGISRPFAVPTTVTLTDAALTLVRPLGTTVVPWSEVRRLSAKHRHWFVVVEKERIAAIVPMRVFDAEQRSAIDLLAKQVRKNRPRRRRRGRPGP